MGPVQRSRIPSAPQVLLYSVALTVTDNGGATGRPRRTSPSPPAGTVIASDDFNRPVANGFGTAPVGGAWTISSTASRCAVTGAVGTIHVPAGVGPSAYLSGVTSASTDLTVKVSTDKAATGNGLYLSLQGRRTTAGDDRVKVRLQSNATVGLSLQRMTSAGVETALTAETVVPGLTYAAGDALNLRIQVTGTLPTTLRSKLWKIGTTEPAAWSNSATDSTSGLQSAGGIGFMGYLSSSATNGPITIRLDDFSAVAP